jgi:hypothetical protein
VEVPPSPKLQLKLNGPTPPVVEAVKVSGTFTSGNIGLGVKLTVGAAATVMLWLDIALPPIASVAVTVAVNGDPVVVA